ncbi:hypothetical protein MCOR02_011299 [Pyricularia oryzae]|nr:hypothetical protein MCOR02_011299 [Pyricularia oryzae]KAI6289052.1 hypothetical protein MCOR34_010783 [Pyricularia oryzae]KAI6448386.1 hypothetical protein MCOR17_010337 [Pyricularia oryzae]KAI6588276.1 hypothetical protein MCOR04_004178 [Pyricularia oryzae]
MMDWNIVAPLNGEWTLDCPPDTGSNSVGPASESSTRKQPRVALACKRCKRRKQRCDGVHPVCRSCEKAKVPCIYERPVRPQYPGGKSLYIAALEERIAFLESRLPGFAEDHFVAAPPAPALAPAPAPAPASHADPNPPPHAGSTISPIAVPDRGVEDGHREKAPESPAFRRRSRQDTLIGSFSDAESSSLVDGVAYLSLRASGSGDADTEPCYLGSTSGATIARMLQASIFDSSRGRRAIFGTGEYPAAADYDQTPAMPPSPTSPASVVIGTAAAFPGREAAGMLFDVFFDRLHTHWPILDRRLYTHLFEKQYEQGELSIQQRGVMHLIYAISSRFLQLTNKPSGVHPETHLKAAIQHMDYILEQHNLGTVQFLLLLALHGQRSPYGAGSWSQVRHAVTLCIELGFHRRRRTAPLPSNNSSPRAVEMRCRVFWAAYCLDRLTSGVLGRPFAIDDREIDAELPSPDPDLRDLTATPSSGSPLTWSNVLPFIHIVKLHRIQSRIHSRIYRVNRQESPTPADLDAEISSLQGELDEWRVRVPHPPPKRSTVDGGAPSSPGWMYDPESQHHDSRDFFELQYHKSVLLLLTALLPTLDPHADARFRAVAHSAASVCAAYRRLERQRTLSYTMLALHSCFVAGLTLVYCVWRGGRRLLGYEALEATRACSQSLAIFGEKWPGAVKYRDVFDALSGSLLRVMMTEDGGFGGGGGGGERLRLDSRDLCLPEDEVVGMDSVLSDAVRNAFMEVDEEAPGGAEVWQMFNEMVQGD